MAEEICEISGKADRKQMVRREAMEGEMTDKTGKPAVWGMIAVQLVLVFFMQKNVTVNMDGIFSYTLANNPYAYLFIDEIYEEFPQDNGWTDAHILKENYVTEKYDRFDYGAVYHHQRHDVHPPLYYFCVHTISSLFPGEYSNFHTMAVNLFALFFVDILMARLFRRLYGKPGYGAVPLMFLCLMEIMLFLFTWARMYMLFFLFCAWYLYIHGKLFTGLFRKRELAQMALCIFLGTLTHYYFYVYGVSLTVFTIAYLACRKKGRELQEYLYAGIVGIAASWIFYPWVLWHIFANERNQYSSFTPWSVERVAECLAFFNKRLFDGRVWAAALVFFALLLGRAFFGKPPGREEEPGRRVFRRITFASGMLYALVIFSLDGDNLYYPTALYMAFIVWASMALIDLFRQINVPWRKESLTVVAAVACVVAVCSPAVLKKYVANAADTAGKMCRGVPLTDSFHQVSQDYGGYDCIYIEDHEDSLLNNYWFEFGEYGQFKKIAQEDFDEHGMSVQDLEGRSHMGNGVVVYAPCECVFDGEEFRLLAGDGDYNIYEWNVCSD